MFSEFVNYFKSVFDVPTAEMLALKELEESKRKLLEAQTAKEYAESMCKYRETQIKRLTTYLHNSTADDK